jgi:hypothetical protein
MPAAPSIVDAIESTDFIRFGRPKDLWRNLQATAQPRALFTLGMAVGEMTNCTTSETGRAGRSRG